MLINFAWQSLLARKVTVGLTVLSVTISLLVMLAIQHIKQEAKTSFTKTISGVDLIIGARTGQLNLLMYSIFNVGNATNNISWKSYEKLSQQKEVAWVIPISLGDSHKGFRVLGTTEAYFEHFKYANRRTISFNQGRSFSGTFEAVIGNHIAKKLNYKVGDSITLSHGISAKSFSEHKHNPFTVVGILAPTGTPIDQTVHVRLDGIEAIHKGWQSGVDLSQHANHANHTKTQDLTPTSITAFMVGLNSKLSTFTFQRKVNTYKNEPMLAILPGIALSELWRMMGTVENILAIISWLVLFAALIGLCTIMLAAMRERRHEFSVLRGIGASRWFILSLIQLESLFIVAVSIAISITAMAIGFWAAQDVLISNYGLNISSIKFNFETISTIVLVIGATIITSIIPCISAYREKE
ncbi:ABC transporter permease [Saccharophagus degradans]|uniref:ABC transporter permease n=1 Tax=Saccharophagus degradans TaxID=86304 RepID=A0AAW7X1L8_9GAMM|nr:ABC transporter permease [Saccharophagus degradans]MDO6421224.1 ABC transporter permease [Saccharophagus degradans]MDO6605865.1 ABC transporter permease [Saccharophagus degradans]